MKLNSYEKWKNSVTSLADDFLAQGKAEEASGLYEKVLLVNPEDPETRHKRLRAQRLLNKGESARREALFLASLAIRNQNPKEGFEILSQLLNQFPDDVNLKNKAARLAVEVSRDDVAESLYAAVGKEYLDRNLPMKAVEAYERIVALSPERFEYYQKIAEILVREGIKDRAIQHYFELTNRYLERRMPAEAATSLEQVLKLDPGSEQASFLLARVCLDQNRLQEGRDCMRRQVDNRLAEGRVEDALRLSRALVELLLQYQHEGEANAERERLARLLFEQGHKAQAVPLFLQVAEYELDQGRLEKYVELLQRTVSHHLEAGELGRAVEIYQALLLATSTRDREKYAALADQFVRELLQRERIRELDQALRYLSGKFEETGDLQESEALMARLADIYISIYKIQEAIKVYRALAEKDAKNPEIYLRLAELYVKEESLPTALDWYVKAVETAAKNGQSQRAEEIFRLALARDPKSAALLARMGHVYYGLGEWDKALEYFEKSLNLDPSQRQAVVGTAMTYAKKGMLGEMVSLAKRLVARGLIAEIVEEYKKALALSGISGEISMALGLLYKDLGFVEEAILEFQKASKDPKYFLQAYNQLGLCFKAQGFDDLAIRQYRKALERPGYSEEETLEIRYNLAVTYEEVKMVREAHELYNDILVLDIGYKDVKGRLKNLAAADTGGKIVSLPSDWDRGGRKT